MLDAIPVAPSDKEAAAAGVDTWRSGAIWSALAQATHNESHHPERN